MRIGIHKNDKIFNHSTLWHDEWIKFCKRENIEYEVIDCYSLNLIEISKKFDIVLWHLSNYALQDMNFGRNIIKCLETLGVRVFPNSNALFHFDDKVAESFVLETIGAPIPKYWTFFTKENLINFLDENRLNYPIISKLKCGSGASNVKLIDNKSNLIKYGNRMFAKGIDSSPSIFFKAKSNIVSSKSKAVFIKRFKRIPDFMRTYINSRKFSKEKGYVYLQEFIKNDGFDLKIVVVGNKVSYIARGTRKNDFRASGGGTLFFDKSLVSRDIVESALETTRKLGVMCMGYDYVVESSTSKGYIIEMSYGFSHTALMDARGYWDSNFIWHDEVLNVPNEIIKLMMKSED